MEAKYLLIVRMQFFIFPSYLILLFALYKMKLIYIFLQKNLHISKKSCTFAPEN